MAEFSQKQLDQIKPDALTPAQIAARAVELGQTKANMPISQAFSLAIMAGIFIGLGATNLLIVKADTTLSFAVSQLVGGLAFSLGLFLVVTAGAELFTGNSLMSIGMLQKKYSANQLIRSWIVVYAGNLVGSLVLACLMHLANLRGMGGGAVEASIMNVAYGKVSMDFATIFVRGILCNLLVCLAVWMSFGARTVVDKLCVCIPPVVAFVACGFEHCVANMYFLPLALITKASGLSEAAVGSVSYFDPVNLQNVGLNLLASTLGNLVGGVLIVACMYWFIYLRKQK